MTLKVQINGFGRIGRLVMRAIIESGRKDLQVVAINGTSNAETMAQLGPDQLLERYRQQVSQLRALALGENALRLQSALADVDNTTRSERQVWQALRGEAAD